MWSLDACILSFFLLLALLAAGNAAQLNRAVGFSLPVVSNHHTANELGYLQVISHRDHGADDELLSPAGANLTTIRPKVAPVSWPVFSVVIGVGTGQHRHSYKFALDFAGGLTWMQCEPCVPELRQQGPIFDSGHSPRYKHVLPTDRDCVPPYTRSCNDRCGFNVRFMAAEAHGYLGKDVFTFAGTTASGNSVDGITFGCAHTTQGFANHDVLAGVVSLSKHPTSLIKQLTAHGVAHSRFSYCLFYDRGQHAPAATRHGFLRFGGDVPNNHPHTQRTPLLYNDDSEYYITIVGVSLNARRIKTITPDMFRRGAGPTGRGGATIDAGTPLTRMVRPAYDKLEPLVVAHMHRHGHQAQQVPGHRLCYRVTSPAIHTDLPSMKLHMALEHTLAIKPNLMFMSVTTHGGSQHLCLAVVPDDEKTVIGAAQQVDTRFTFDLSNNLLFFTPEKCQDDAS